MTRRYSQYVGHPIRDLLFPERIGRMACFIRSVLNSIITGVLYLPIDRAFNEDTFTSITLLYSIVTTIPLVAFLFWGIVLPRLKDLNWKRILALLLFVPGVNAVFSLLLVLIPGESATA